MTELYNILVQEVDWLYKYLAVNFKMVFPAGADSINWFFMSCIFMLLFI
jgi:hypothetical protein